MDTALTRLTNDDLIASLRSLVSRSNELEADIIEHIQEVETRGIHLDGFARTGEHDPDRMRLACGPHNSHAAEKMYGRAFMLRARTRRRPRPSQGREAEAPSGSSNSSRDEHTRV